MNGDGTAWAAEGRTPYRQMLEACAVQEGWGMCMELGGWIQTKSNLKIRFPFVHFKIFGLAEIKKSKSYLS